ncbi:ABC transporter substrate-binding protein [Bradyrhizobium huanghuaihaiense]|uniref:ABC transporter substrate-binding protein n=1 Tax=Bradyrhizobium huanghuaihaiense TaxID=990078 RepID=UPI0021A9EE7B|nr:ABC transporter substrate-binding protein [Bradyrhizobium sp. CB3035]UWU76526.1 ABC transporter substrate-binding protein [Bradyrhizobium sp. CB3035]
MLSLSKLSLLARAAAIGLAVCMAASPGNAQQIQSRLFDVTKNKKLRVCMYPLYYAISFRDPKTNELSGLDIDLAKEFAKELSAELQFVESAFGTFVADLQSNKCEIGMFALGATLKRAQAVEFSKPYMLASVFAVAKNGGRVKEWADLDKPGIKIAVLLGSYIENVAKTYFKQATIVSIQPPTTREAELAAGRADAILVDYPTVLRAKQEFDWAISIDPPEKLAPTLVAYAVLPGDQIWLNYINLFVDTIKLDGRLMTIAKKYKLDGSIAP